MAPVNPNLVFLSVLFLLGLACPTPGDTIDINNFESPWDDLPRWSKDWTRSDWMTAMDRAQHARIFNYDSSDRRPREHSSPPPSCASAWAKQNAGVGAAAPVSAASAASTAGHPMVTNQYAETGQRSGLDDYGYYNGMQGPVTYPFGGSVFQQHPNLDQFNRQQTTSSSWIPGSANTYNDGRSNEPSQASGHYDQYANQQLDQFSQSYNPSIPHSAGQSHPESAHSIPSQRSSAYYLIPSNQDQQYRSGSSGGQYHPVQTLPDFIETPSSLKSASQSSFFSPALHSNLYASSYRAAETPQEKPPQSAEDAANSIKTTNPQNYYASDYYRQQIQQALADGKQLVAGIPNAVLNQQLAPGTADKLPAQASPVFATTAFPVTTLGFDPEDMRRVYGQYYVPPVFSLVNRQPNSYDAAPNAVVRDVLQYLLNQYQLNGGVNNGINGGYRNQRLLPDISSQYRVLHGFAPLQKLSRQSFPQLPSFTGDNQLLPPNMYRNDKWEPKTNLIVHDPVNLGDFEHSGLNQRGQYAYRSSPCSRQKRQSGSIWGYYPELTPGARMTEPPFFPGIKPSQSRLDGSYTGRTAIPGLPYGDPLRQSMGGLGQQMGGYGQQLGGFGLPLDGLGQPMGGMNPAFGNPAYPDYSTYQGKDAVSGLQQFFSGITQLVPMVTGNGPQLFRK